MTELAVRTLTFGAGAITPQPASHHTLDFHLGAAVRSSCRLDGRTQRRVQTEGDIDIIPAGVNGTWELDAPAAALLVLLPTSVLSSTAESLGLNSMELRPALQVRDSGLTHLGLALRDEFAAGCPAGRTFVDSLAAALAVRLLQGHAREPLLTAPRGVLQPWRLRRVCDYIETHLEHELPLAELAAVAGFSVSHFKPLFKRATGMSVHQFVIERRVARARTLLVQGGSSLSDVALAAGFAHQSHMARWVKRVLGVTPARVAGERFTEG